jgi:hypothetical protein
MSGRILDSEDRGSLKYNDEVHPHQFEGNYGINGNISLKMYNWNSRERERVEKQK